MILLTLVLALSFAGTAFAADWATNYGGFTGGVSIQATAVDALGNVYLAGNFSGSTFTIGSLTLTKIGSQDAFVAKLDSSGNVVWATNFGGSAASVVGQSIAIDGSGNVYMGGYFLYANLTTPSLTMIGTSDAFAIKLDSTGATTWAKNFGGSGASAYGYGIAVDDSGNVYLGGYFTSANLTTPALTMTGAYDAFAIKLDSTGATTWAKNFGGISAATYGTGIAVDGSGNVYLGGYFYNANLTTPALTRIGYCDAFAIKLSSTGATTWAKNFGGSTAWIYGYDIAVDGSGNVYLGGNFNSANLTTPSLTLIGTQDAFAIKLSSTGAITWAKNFGGSGATVYGRRITVDTSGSVYLGGHFQSASLTTPVLTKIGSIDALAIKLSSVGGTTWSMNFGGSGANAYGYDIAADSSGNVYLGGAFGGDNLTTPSLTKNGLSDALAIKLDSTGATTWAKDFYAVTGSGNAVINATTKDMSGNLYIAGYFNGAIIRFGSVTLTRIGIQDAFVVKLDAAGNVLWAKNFGGSGAYAYGQSIAVDGSGNVYQGGYFYNANLTTPDLTRIGTYDAFAIKLDSTGATTWAKNFGGSGARAYGNGIAVDGSGNVYLGGYFYTANLTTPALTKIGTYDAFAIKLDSTGATTWANNFGGSGASAYGNGIAVDGSGNVYLGGYFGGNLTTPALTRIGTYDAFAIKLDSTGATTWSKNFGGSAARAYGQSIAVDGSGNVYLGGYFYTANLTTPALTKIGTYDAFAIKLDSTGATTWAKNLGGSGAYTYGSGIAVDDSGNVYLGGYFTSANLTTPTLTKIGTSDVFAVKLDSSGATTWTKNYGGSGASAYGNSIAVDGSGNVSLGGYFSGANLTTPALSKIGTQDALIINTQLYTLTFATGANGSLSGVSPQTVSSGINSTPVAAVPDANYHFVNWTGDNGFVTTTDNPLTVSNVSTSMTITANFEHDAMNGACGSSNGQFFATAPVANLCSVGTTTGSTGSGPWTWTCSGEYGGTDAGCSADIDITPPTDGTLIATAGDASVALVWTPATDSGSGLASYKVVYADGAIAPANCNGTAIYSGTNTAYTHNGRTNGQEYAYRVCAYDNVNNVSIGATATATPVAAGTLPETPGGITLSGMKTTGPKITWSSSTGADSYNAYRSDDNATWTLLGSAIATSYTDTTAPNPNTVYYWTVSAVNTTGESAKGTSVSGRTALRKGWNMISAPYNTTGKSPVQTYGSWATWVWTWASTSNADPDNSGVWQQVTTVQPGMSQFAWVYNDSTVLTASGSDNATSVTVTLVPGWNLIANHLSADLTDIGTNWLVDGSVMLTDAITTNVIGGSLYSWNGSAYDLLNIATDNPPVAAWDGYWILNMDSADHTLTMK